MLSLLLVLFYFPMVSLLPFSMHLSSWLKALCTGYVQLGKKESVYLT